MCGHFRSHEVTSGPVTSHCCELQACGCSNAPEVRVTRLFKPCSGTLPLQWRPFWVMLGCFGLHDYPSGCDQPSCELQTCGNWNPWEMWAFRPFQALLGHFWSDDDTSGSCAVTSGHTAVNWKIFVLIIFCKKFRVKNFVVMGGLNL